MQHEHDKPASFYDSPAAAMQAPPEEFLYLACLHEGTGVEKPDFLAVVDAENGRIVHETPMPNVGDELHHFGWNRCSSACHGPDRKPGTTRWERSGPWHAELHRFQPKWWSSSPTFGIGSSWTISPFSASTTARKSGASTPVPSWRHAR